MTNIILVNSEYSEALLMAPLLDKNKCSNNFILQHSDISVMHHPGSTQL